ncbi:sentrin-specific protease 1-like protein [Euroglyphus maynei]|uniref:Sentrin-specific protease 1-like protein n=1 Tax=Euroglyphus maynei TaxID=6958 RepID=A0A1Y3B5Z9_EURMA|nr:sentrin-specific protease 1-like protein [Euroglyphus maynei]
MEHVTVPNRRIFNQRDYQTNESAIISPSTLLRKSILPSNKDDYEHRTKNSYSLYNLVQSKGFTTTTTTTVHQNDSRKNSTSNINTSRLNMIQNYWNIPEKSNEFKSSVENKISLVYSKPSTPPPSSSSMSKSSFMNNEKLIVDNNKSNMKDIQIYEKLNHVKIFKNDRETITTKIKSMFEPFIPYNFYYKFKRFIPYIQRDYQISDHVKQLEDKEKETVVPLTEEIEDEIDEILNSPDQLLVSAYSINIHTKDIMTLEGCNWLNDAVCIFHI